MGAFWRFNGARLLPIAAIHDRSVARAALVMAADEFHAGTPGAAVGHQLVRLGCWLQADDPAVRVVRQEIEIAVWPVADVANSPKFVLKQPLLADDAFSV